VSFTEDRRLVAGGAGAGEINSEVILNAEVGSAALDPAVGAPPQDEAP
jgi:hypothetical protein